MATRNLSLSRLKHIGSVSSKLHHQLGTIRNMVGAIDQERDRLTALMIEQERAGITEGRPHYQQGKYLYLIHPMRKGKRLREYIGSDVQKRHDAEVKIANTKIFREYFNTLASLELQAQTILRTLQRLTEPKQHNKRSKAS